MELTEDPHQSPSWTHKLILEPDMELREWSPEMVMGEGENTKYLAAEQDHSTHLDEGCGDDPHKPCLLV